MKWKSLWTAGILSLAAGGAHAFEVSNVGSSAYRIDGSNNPALRLTRGVTYTFTLAANGHPFWIKTAQVTGTGSAFSSGVTNNGIQTGTLTFTVPASAPNTLFYICQFHGSMNGRIDIVDPTAVQPGSWTAVRGNYR